MMTRSTVQNMNRLTTDTPPFFTITRTDLCAMVDNKDRTAGGRIRVIDDIGYLLHRNLISGLPEIHDVNALLRDFVEINGGSVDITNYYIHRHTSNNYLRNNHPRNNHIRDIRNIRNIRDIGDNGYISVTSSTTPDACSLTCSSSTTHYIPSNQIKLLTLSNIATLDISTLNIDKIYRKYVQQFYGLNELSKTKTRSFLTIFISNTHDKTLLLLFAAGILSLILGFYKIIADHDHYAWIEGTSIILAVFVIIMIGSVNQYTQESLFKDLDQKSQKISVKYFKNYSLDTKDSSHVIVGDVIYLEPGDAVPADCVIVTPDLVICDESMISGESGAVCKSSDEDPFLVSGTYLTEGAAKAVVVCTGRSSVKGRILSLMSDRGKKTPLEVKIEGLAQDLARKACYVAVVLFVLQKVKIVYQGVYSIRGVMAIVVESISIVVMAVPEGLPMAVTLALSFATKRMLRDKSLVRDVSACEAMNNVDYICTDKTGTLTHNEMTVECVLAGGAILHVDEKGDEFGEKMGTECVNINNNIKKDMNSKNDNMNKENNNNVKSNIHNNVNSNDGMLLNSNVNSNVNKDENNHMNNNMNSNINNINSNMNKDENTNMNNMNSNMNNNVNNMNNNINCKSIRNINTNVNMHDNYNTANKNPNVTNDNKKYTDNKKFIYFNNDSYKNSTIPTRIHEIPPTHLTRNTKVPPTTSIHRCKGGLLGRIAKHTSQAALDLSLKNMVLNSSAFENANGTYIGSKSESALLQIIKAHGIDYAAVRRECRVVRRVPFSSKNRYMSSMIESNGKFIVFFKGAPEKITQFCTTQEISGRQLPVDKKTLTQFIKHCDRGCFRSIALSYCVLDMFDPNAVMLGLYPCTLLCAIGMEDPVRQGVGEEIVECKRAGINLVMLTGDKMAMAENLARRLGILTGSGLCINGHALRTQSDEALVNNIHKIRVVARARPADKQRFVEALQRRGCVVAVTGDGTNDGPALKTADVGFRMGIAGTDISKAAASIILLDDLFASIVRSIEWGRCINNSVRKFIQFQLTTTVTTVIIAMLSSLFSATGASAFSPLKLLWINIVMDTFAALALSTDRPTRDLLRRSPEPKGAPIITDRMKWFIGLASVYQFTLIGLLYLLRLKLTLIFNTFIFLQLFNEINARSLDPFESPFIGLLSNRLFIGTNVVVVVVQYLIIQHLGIVFKTVPLSSVEWIYSILLGFTIVVYFVGVRVVQRHRIEKLERRGGWKRSMRHLSMELQLVGAMCGTYEVGDEMHV